MPLYNTINNFLIKHISEITFAFVSLIYIFFWRYFFLLVERAAEGATSALFSNHPNWKSVLKFADSFMVFILTALLLIPLIKILLEKYLEPRLSTPYLTWIVLGAVIISYIYYMLVYSKHLHDK